MSTCLNHLDQPIGPPVPNWQRSDGPPRSTLVGARCRLEPADPDRHAADLFEALAEDPDGRTFTYLPYGPFDSIDAYQGFMRATCLGDDPLFFAIVDGASGRAIGLASYLRIDPVMGVIEVGHLQFTPALQRTTAATEAMFLMMRQAFVDLRYRRYEWKCDSLNAPSCQAAERLGFQYEGTFRQATVYKGRNRDTAWYSILDHEWPALEREFDRWLDPGNFELDGTQRTPLRTRLRVA